MAQNQAFDAVFALSPRLLLRLNEASGTSHVDSSGNALTFTASASIPDTAGIFYSAKNDASTNKAWLCGTAYSRRAAITNTTANIPTGVTLNLWVKADVGIGTYTTPFDCRSGATGRNGIAIMYNTRNDLAGSGSYCTVFLTDTSGGVSYFQWADGGNSAWWRDGLWHMVTVQALGAALTIYIDGVVQTTDASNTTTTGASGSFTDPDGSQYFQIGAYLDLSQDANGCTTQLLSWHNSILSAAQVLALYHAGSYTGGTAASGYFAMGVNGGFHGDASSSESYAPVRVQDGSNDRFFVTSWPSLHNAAVAAANSAADSTCPTFPSDSGAGPKDPLNRKAISFDGTLQASASTPRPFLTLTTPFVGSPSRITFAVCAQTTASALNGITDLKVCTLSRASAGANVVGLSQASDAPCFRVNAANRIPSGTSQPAFASIPSAGTFGVSSGAGGTNDDIKCYCRGSVAAGNGTLATGANYSELLDGNLVIGCTNTAATPSSHFSGYLHEVFIASRPWTSQEWANFNTYCNTKWLSGATLTKMVQVWGNSIDVGTPSAGTTTDNNLWQLFIGTSYVAQTLWVNPSLGGMQSGLLFQTPPATNPFAGNGDDVATRDASLARWSAHTGSLAADIAIWKNFDNDCVHTDNYNGVGGNAGDVSAQSIANYLAWKAIVLAARPSCKIIVVLPPATNNNFSASGELTRVSIAAYFAANPTAAHRIITITGVSAWIHPTADDFPIIGRQIGGAMAQFFPQDQSNVAARLLLLVG